MQGAHPTARPLVVDLRTTPDEAGMAAALEAARRGLARGELPIGAVVVADGQVISTAHTEEVTQRRLLVHAELLALEAADRIEGWDRRRATLYTTLEPCLMCLGATATAMVGRIVWALESDGDGAGRGDGTGDGERTAATGGTCSTGGLSAGAGTATAAGAVLLLMNVASSLTETANSLPSMSGTVDPRTGTWLRAAAP